MARTKSPKDPALAAAQLKALLEEMEEEDGHRGKLSDRTGLSRSYINKLLQGERTSVGQGAIETAMAFSRVSDRFFTTDGVGVSYQSFVRPEEPQRHTFYGAHGLVGSAVPSGTSWMPLEARTYDLLAALGGTPHGDLAVRQAASDAARAVMQHPVFERAEALARAAQSESTSVAALNQPALDLLVELKHQVAAEQAFILGRANEAANTRRIVARAFDSENDDEGTEVHHDD